MPNRANKIVGVNPTIFCTQYPESGVAQGKGWTPAYALASGDILLTDEDEFVTISAVRRRSLSDPVDVYNMTVGDAEDDQYHTYFVGEDSVLVHNACKPTNKEVKNARQKAVRDHKKQVYEELFGSDKINNTRYNFSKQELIDFRKAGKITGYDGCHLLDVKRCQDMGRLDLIADKNNVILLKRYGETSHFTSLHNNNWSNATDLEKAKELFSWVADNLKKLGL